MEEFCDDLRQSMEDIFSNLHDYVKILNPEDEWSRSFIKKTECDSVVERGEKYDQIHCHCFIGISHYTKLQLDRKEIHDKICEDLGLKSVYLSKITVLRRSTNQDLENWISYTEKNLNKK